MRLESLESLVAVVLAGSVVMERIVTVAKTIGPTIFGEPGVGPGGVFGVLDDPRPIKRWRTWRVEQWRRVKVLLLVFGASFVTAWAVSERATGCLVDVSFLCRKVVYGTSLDLPWWMFAILISGGSALWTNFVGLVSALKDVKAEQRRAVRELPAQGATVLVVNPADKPALGIEEPPGRGR